MIRREFQIMLNIEAEMVRKMISPKEMANAMKISEKTWYQRRKKPGNLTIDELLVAASMLKMDPKNLM